MEMEVRDQLKVVTRRGTGREWGSRDRQSEVERKQKGERKQKILPTFLSFLRKWNKSAILTMTGKEP